MQPLKRSPHYLVRNPHSFCFRVNVPKDLQRVVGRRELRYSLKTGYVGVARVKAQIIASQVHQIFRCLRKGGRRLAELTDEKIQELVQQYLKKSIENLESRHYEEDPRGTIQDREDFTRYLGELDSIKDDIILYLGTGDYETVERSVALLLEKNGIEGVEKNSASYVKLCRGLLRAQLQSIEIEKQQMSTGLMDAPNFLSQRQPIPGIQAVQSGGKGPLISEVIEQYADETKKSWREKTKDENLAILNFFKRVVGDLPIQSVTRKTVGGFKQTLRKLPPNINKNPEYRKKSIPEILNMEVKRTMSDTTVSKYLTRVGALFDYARKNGLYQGENPATGMSPKNDKRDHEARAPFTQEELVKLFRSEDYIKDSFREPYQFWMPILGLFTGARLNELAQLHLSDIKQVEDGVWVFDINEEGEKQLKAKASRRIIPIHPFLLEDLKFLSWVDRLKAKGQQRLFPELKKERDGYGRKVTRWFNADFKKRCGIESTDGRKRDFHSFRSSFITQLVRQKVNDRMRLQVEGHSAGKDMTSVYADPFPATQLYDEVISKLDYGIDLSDLKNSKFVIKG
jgi:integrase